MRHAGGPDVGTSALAGVGRVLVDAAATLSTAAKADSLASSRSDGRRPLTGLPTATCITPVAAAPASRKGTPIGKSTGPAGCIRRVVPNRPPARMPGNGAVYGTLLPRPATGRQQRASACSRAIPHPQASLEDHGGRTEPRPTRSRVSPPAELPGWPPTDHRKGQDHERTHLVHLRSVVPS
ncbi:MAG: hypothetical protein JWO67_4334 [Streptosporangiaceae bacterium]|nr:hypothetical protein [Streptosporangiaceae bacterium]